METIQTSPNMYNALVAETESICSEPAKFAEQLEASLARWRSSSSTLVWIDLPASRAALVPVAIAAGFRYHSVVEDGVKLVFRLVETACVPPAATHYVGAGGVVIRNDTDLLVVSERYRRSGGRHLKLPGGALHPGEHIVTAVRREIREETGIETRFSSLVCFRHWHGYRHGKSDIYFVCRLDPVTFEISRQEDEIEECFWMPVSEFLSVEEVHQFNKRIVRASLESEGIMLEEIPDYGTPETHEFFMPPRRV